MHRAPLREANQVVRAFERLNASRNTNQTSHFDSSRVYIRRRWKRTRSEPLLTLDSERRPATNGEARRGETLVARLCIYVQRERERRESRRADDRFHDRARQLLRDMYILKLQRYSEISRGKTVEAQLKCYRETRTILMNTIFFCPA